MKKEDDGWEYFAVNGSKEKPDRRVFTDRWEHWDFEESWNGKDWKPVANIAPQRNNEGGIGYRVPFTKRYDRKRRSKG